MRSTKRFVLISPKIARAAIALCLSHASVFAQTMSGSMTHFQEQTGEALYKAICQGCHMPDAMGAVGAGAFPALAGDAKLGAAGYPIVVVLNGQKAMPPFGWALNDEQVAAVVNYVRSHFGNDYPEELSAEDVNAAR
jgi:mono/diheme cytochrome c family protein